MAERFADEGGTPAVADAAASLRARHTLRTADTLVAATALQSGCEAFITNDSRLSRVTELRVILLDDTTLSPSPPDEINKLTSHKHAHLAQFLLYNTL